MRKVWQLAIASMLGLVLAACSSGGAGETMTPGSTGGAQVQESATPADDAIKVEQIDYEMRDGVEGGNRRVLFGYTNNSDYTVVSVELLMAMPEDVEDDELESAFADLIDRGSIRLMTSTTSKWVVIARLPSSLGRRPRTARQPLA